MKRQRQLFLAAFIGVALLAVILGYVLCLNFQRSGFSAGSFYVQLLLLVGAMLAIERVASRKLCEFEKLRNAMRRGVIGEEEVAMILEGLPDGFTVINDLSTAFGNIDHVVIGPTGAYVIDTKSWRGAVTADGRKELLLNGKSPSKPTVKCLLRTVMSVQEKLKVLTGANPYLQGVLAFTSAHVDASFGSTGYVHCVRAERLPNYIAEWKPEKKWTADEVEKVARAFAALASMDAAFASSAPAPVSNPLPRSITARNAPTLAREAA